MQNPWRKRAFYCGLALVFIRCSLVSEVITYEFGIPLYPLYIFGVPAIAGMVFTGGWSRAFRFKPTYFWICFGLWIIPSAAFSVWKGSSVELLNSYLRTDLIMMFVIAGLAIGWRECKLIFYTVAASAASTLVLLVLFGQLDESGRKSLQFGAISNSNDYAAHLIFLLPFVLWVLLSARTKILRIASTLVLAFGMFQILASASRGALIGTVAASAVCILKMSSKQRKFTLVAIPIVLAITFTLLPRSAITRILSFSESSSASQEALESSHIRQRLLEDSILATFKHPLLGVGAGQFSVYRAIK